LTKSLASIKQLFKQKAFRLAERHLKLHITPVHFYSPIPALCDLSADTFDRASECIGLELAPDEQLRWLETTLLPYAAEYDPPVNTGLSRLDALVLYAMIRSKKPRMLVEIGSGESTKISLAALDKNAAEGSAGRLIAVEPYPKPYLRTLSMERFELIEKPVQEVELALLCAADLLFIDSSHVSKVGSDVNYEMLEIVPRLRVGALVHWHDIMIPMNYPRSWVESGSQFWNESYLVHAFMLHNERFRVRWAAKYMQVTHPDALRSAFAAFQPDDADQQLSSFWVERIR
jgi:hypothetical protein